MSQLTIAEPPSSSKVWLYEMGDVVTLPYVNELNSKFFPEELLCVLYARMRKEQLVDLVFHSEKGYTLNDFVAEMRTKCPLIHMQRAGDRLEEVIGFSWLPTIEGNPGQRKATIGFCCFRHTGPARTHAAGMLALRWYFKELNIDVIMGAIYKHNKLALRYAKALNFKVIADIPKFLPSLDGLQTAVLVMLERGEFLASDSRPKM